MAQAGQENSEAGAFTKQMKELHVKLHQSCAKPNNPFKSPPITHSSASKIEKGQSPSEKFDSNKQVSRSVYTWTKDQPQNPQTLKRTDSPVTVETNCNFDFKRNIVTDAEQKRATPFQKCMVASLQVIHNDQQPNSNQASMENSPDSGLSLGSERIAPANSFGNPAKQEVPVRFPHQMLNMAFKPVGPRSRFNGISPATINLSQPAQNHGLTPVKTGQHMQQLPTSHNLQPTCPKNMSSSSYTHPISPNLLPPVLAVLKNSPSPVETSEKMDPALLFPASTNSTPHRIPLSPFLKDNSKTPLSQINKSVTFSNNSSSRSSSPRNIISASIDDQSEEEKTSVFKDVPTCSCNQSPKMILCKACGEIFTGRLRQKCLAHPNQIFLMDLSCCPQCQSENLKDIVRSKKA